MTPSARSLPVRRRYPATYESSWIDGLRLNHDFRAVREFVILVGQPRAGHRLVAALLDAHPNTLIAEPPGTLGELCGFLALPAPAGYVEACQPILYAPPHRTRDDVAGTPKLLELVAARAAANAALDGCCFDARAPLEEST